MNTNLPDNYEPTIGERHAYKLYVEAGSNRGYISLIKEIQRTILTTRNLNVLRSKSAYLDRLQANISHIVPSDIWDF